MRALARPLGRPPCTQHGIESHTGTGVVAEAGWPARRPLTVPVPHVYSCAGHASACSIQKRMILCDGGQCDPVERPTEASSAWPLANMAVVAGLVALALIQASSVVGVAGTHNLIQLGWAEGESLGVLVHLSASKRVVVCCTPAPLNPNQWHAMVNPHMHADCMGACTAWSTAPLILANHRSRSPCMCTDLSPANRGEDGVAEAFAAIVGPAFPACPSFGPLCMCSVRHICTIAPGTHGTATRLPPTAYPDQLYFQKYLSSHIYWPVESRALPCAWHSRQSRTQHVL
jgi:hypothetical protein